MVSVVVHAALDGLPPRMRRAEAPIVLQVCGAVDRVGARRLQVTLDTVVTTPASITVDLGEASAADATLLHILCQFRRRRREHDLPVRFVGLHEGNLPELADLPLGELFVVYEQAR